MTIRGPALAALAVAGCLAPLALTTSCDSSCAGDAPVGSCADSLSGVWVADIRAPSGEPMAFHITDAGQDIAVYPMFDDSYPYPELAGPAGPSGHDKRRDAIAYAPAYFAIQRRGLALVGTRSFRATHAGVVCTIERPAAIRSCADHRLELSWVPVTRIDWPDCQTRGASQYTRVSLTRE